MIEAAKQTHCEAIHPGYGFLSEQAVFARRCQAEGLTFIGPGAELLALFGDKGRARAAAATADVPTISGINRAVSVEEAQDFFASLGEGHGMMIKAVAGGGGRGARAVSRAEEIKEAYARCQSEALNAFGNGDLYVEALMTPARHIEVQILGDSHGAVVSLGERDCSLQRRYQNCRDGSAPNLPESLREEIIAASLRLAARVAYTNLGTIEFLVNPTAEQPFAFIEANARLQVEHTVTEAVTGVDLVQAQIRLAAGASLQELGLGTLDRTAPRGYAIQTRVNMETAPSGGADGVRGSGGVRTDGLVTPAYDQLLKPK